MLPIEYLAGLSFTIAMGMALTALGSLGSEMPHYVLDYFRDFAPGLMSSIVIPLIFYARHAKARTFIVRPIRFPSAISVIIMGQHARRISILLAS